MNPKYPLYVISKGRWESRLTAKALEKRRIPYHIVIEPQEYEQYAVVIDPTKIFILPFSNLGQGSIPARNWVWEHSIQAGYERHWILDDNIRDFFYLFENRYYQVDSGVTFRIMEDFVDRYKNIALAGPQYFMFTPRKDKFGPLSFNTRVYSCILIKNDLSYRWRGRYNEDTDLSLRVLKDGWCTVLFRAFPAHKEVTMKMTGGNTDELYQKDGRYQMALSLQRQHPDVTKIVWKWGRWQHSVDYRRFRNNQLCKCSSLTVPLGINNYGMELLPPGGE